MSKDLLNKINNYTTYNQDTLIESYNLEIGSLKVGQLEYDGKYISINDVGTLQYNFPWGF